MRTSIQITAQGAAEDFAVTDPGAPKSSEAGAEIDVVSRFGTRACSTYCCDALGLDLRRGQSGIRRGEPARLSLRRFVIMVALAFAVLLVLQRGAGRWVERSDWGLFVLAGLTGYTLYQLGFILGLSRTSPFSSSLLIAMVPLFTVLILAVMGEPTPLQGWVGLGVALVGVALFLLDKRGASAGTLVGDVLSIGAAVSFAVYGIITRPLVRKYPAETYTAWSVLAGDRASAPRLAAGCAEAGLALGFSPGMVQHRLSRHLPGLHRVHSLELRHRPARCSQGRARLACWCRLWPGYRRRFSSQSRSGP